MKQRKKGGATASKDEGAVQVNGNTAQETLQSVKATAKDVVQNDWDYKLALVIITALAFLTRFWGISHPDQVVFDEVHFGKVWMRTSTCCMVAIVTSAFTPTMSTKANAPCTVCILLP